MGTDGYQLDKMDKDINGDEYLYIDCPKCKGHQGIIRKDSLKIHCFVCKRR